MKTHSLEIHSFPDSSPGPTTSSLFRQKDTLRVKELSSPPMLLDHYSKYLRRSKIGWSDLLAGNMTEYWPGCELKAYVLLRDGVQY